MASHLQGRRVDISLVQTTARNNLINLLEKKGIAQLSTKPANTVTINLLTLDLSHSKLITETSLEHLSRCENLTRLDCRHSLQVSTQSLIKFAAKSDHDLHVKDIKLVEKRQVTRRI